MNATLEKIFSSGHVLDENGAAEQAFPTSIQYSEGQVLYDIVSQPDVQRTMEIGLAYGISTLFMAQAHRDKQSTMSGIGTSPVHTAIDPLQTEYWRNIGLLNLERAGLRELVRFFERPSSSVLPQLVDEGDSFDFVFVDGAHFFDFALLDLWYTNKLLRTGGLVMVHDVYWPAIRKLVAFVLRNYDHLVVDMTMAPATGPIWRLYARFLQYVVQSPADFFGWGWPLWRRHRELYTRNFCIFRKVGEDQRHWEHYKSF